MNSFFNLLGWVCVIILLLMLSKSCDKKNEVNNLHSSISDSLKVYRNFYNQHVAQIAVIETENKNQFLDIKSKDSSIIALQQLVKKTNNLLSATIIKNTSTNNISGTTTVTTKDTIVKDSITYVYPEYAFARSNQWEDIAIKANKDSTSIKYKVFNEFEITQTKKRTGLFKDRETEITILNKNPNTETLNMRSYSIKNKSNNKIYFIAGTVAGVVLRSLVVK